MKQLLLAVLLAAFAIPSSTLRGEEDSLDLSSPLAAIKSFAKAVDNGDVARAKKCMKVTGAANQALSAAGIEYLVAGQKFKKAVNAKFGENSDKSIAAQLDDQAPSDFIDQIIAYPDTLKQSQEDGETTVSVGDVDWEMEQIDGDWKISADKMGEKTSEAVTIRETAATIASTKLVNDLTAEVNAGKFKDTDELKEALENRLELAKKQPATSPASQPTTEP